MTYRKQIASDGVSSLSAGLVITNIENSALAAKLVIANLEQSESAAELVIANIEKEARATELIVANHEKEARAAELVVANYEKITSAAELVIANIEKSTRAAELVTANIEKSARAAELVITNQEKKARAAELVIANQEKKARAAELVVLNLKHEATRMAELDMVILKLEVAREEAKTANKAKSDFLAAMSHDLRTPLNAIIGFSDMIRLKTFGPLGDPHYEEYINDIHNSGSLLVSLINDVLDLSKIEAGKYDLVEEPLDISELIETSFTQLRQLAETAGQTLSSDILPHMPYLLGDKRVMIQILNNLLSNAIKFSPSGGKIDVVVKTDDNKNIVLSVTDTGMGMSKEDIVDAQKPFGQADSTHARRHEGSGLGLYLCGNFMTLFKGILSLQSEIDKGTTVTLKFPPERTIFIS